MTLGTTPAPTTAAPNTTTEPLTTMADPCAKYDCLDPNGFCSVSSFGTPECVCPSECGVYVDTVCNRTCTTTAFPTTTASLNPCDSYECHFNGSCFIYHSEPKCRCPSDIPGVFIVADQCANTTSYCKLHYPCIHGVCVDKLINSTDGYSYSYECLCEAGWTGDNCNQIAPICTPTNDNCVHGICVKEHDDYKCLCQSGWSGALCDTDINECELSTICGCGSTCINTPG